MGSDGVSEILDDFAEPADGDDVAERARALVRARLFDPATSPRVGRFILLKKLGAGGMGEVFAAYDPKLDRKVALKMLHAGRDHSAHARERLLREGKAMARVAHPNLVAVYEVDAHEDQVFVAMEHVAGQTLSAWLADGTRTRDEVVDVLLAAGRGLAAIHDAGLVHRDFKPSNVLVGEDGRARVADFGLARALSDQSATDTPDPPSRDTGSGSGSNARLTATGAAVGTPAYMAPEQRRGDALDARADQFAFCVTAIEALRRRRPSTDAGARPGRGEDAAAELPVWLRRPLRRGLAASPRDRYEDLRDLLRAVELGRGAPRRWWAAAGVVVVLAAVGVTSWLGGSAESPCAHAEAAFAETWNPERAGTLERRLADRVGELGPRTSRRIADAVTVFGTTWRAAARDACEATRVRHLQSDGALDLRAACLHDARLRVDAAVRVAAGGDLELALEAPALIAEVDLDRCSDLDALRRRAPLPAEADAMRVATLQGQLTEVKVLRGAGRYEDATILAQTLVDEAEAIDYALLLAEAQAELGSLLSEAGQLDRAEQQLYAATDAASRARDDRVAARAWTVLARHLGRHRSRFGEAEQAARVAEQLIARDPSAGRLAAALTSARGSVFSAKGEHQRALERHREAAALYEPIDAVAAAREEHAAAGTLFSLGEFDEARTLYERSLATLQKELGKDHPAATFPLAGLGWVAMAQQRANEAQEILRDVLALRQAVLHPGHLQIADAHLALGNAYYRGGAYAEARTEYATCLELREAIYGLDAAKIGDVVNNLGAVSNELGRSAEARSYFERAYRIASATLGPAHPNLAIPAMNIASACLVLDDIPCALARGKEAAERFAEGQGPDHPRTIRATLVLATSHREHGEPERAVALVEPILTQIAGRDLDAALVADVRYELARARIATGVPPRRLAAEIAEIESVYTGNPRRAFQLKDLRAWKETLNL